MQQSKENVYSEVGGGGDVRQSFTITDTRTLPSRGNNYYNEYEKLKGQLDAMRLEFQNQLIAMGKKVRFYSRRRMAAILALVAGAFVLSIVALGISAHTSRSSASSAPAAAAAVVGISPSPLGVQQLQELISSKADDNRTAELLQQLSRMETVAGRVNVRLDEDDKRHAELDARMKKLEDDIGMLRSRSSGASRVLMGTSWAAVVFTSCLLPVIIVTSRRVSFDR